MKALLFLTAFLGLFHFSSKSDTDMENLRESAHILEMYRYVDHTRPSEPWNVQKELEDEGITVLTSQKGYDGLKYSFEDLASKAGHINIVKVPAHFYDKLKKLGFAVCGKEHSTEKGVDCHQVSYSGIVSPKDDSFAVRVYKSSGKKLCELDSGVPIEEMEKEFTKPKIVVYRRYKAFDGKSYPFVCGGLTGEINVYLIERKRLSDSMLLGFRECAFLELTGTGCYSGLPE